MVTQAERTRQEMRKERSALTKTVKALYISGVVNNYNELSKDDKQRILFDNIYTRLATIPVEDDGELPF